MDQASPSRQEQLRSLGQALRQRLASHIALIRFALVGGSGYLVYQAVLFLMYDSPLFWFLPAKDTSTDIIFFEHGDVRFLIATLVATSLTLVVVFTGHNLWTFRDRGSVRKPLWMRFGQFVAMASVAAFGIVTVTVNVLTVQFDMYHFMALPIGVSLGGIWDWLWYSRFVWRRAKKRRLEA
jgi:putative flippase GtrA